ncbi:MAG: UDP-N-acetylglucosamine 1-carboxyvinyltransferase [Thermoguttaceae bacterium]|nr:UDP-N-acetylglucosamine 1-carboxyvinyltransferase [Thermoguttaceae bacterium]
MRKIKIEGRFPVTGTIRISGAKNSSVALVPAALLADDNVILDNIPDISDIEALCEILEFLGAEVTRKQSVMEIHPATVKNNPIPEEISSKLRASYYFMGALLAKFKKAIVCFPGGCGIGARPIDIHLKGFEALGATVTVDDNKYTIEAQELRGANIYLDIASVGATINLMLAAVKATGTTVIENVSLEPEIVNVATLLNKMGAKISGAGTGRIVITGVEQLHGCFAEVIPDRIEAGTYMALAALCGENLRIENIIPEHLESFISKLQEIGVNIKIGTDYAIITKKEKYKPTEIITALYPGFPTDLQQPFTILLTQSTGKSTVTETIWENRFMHIPYLVEMGARITVKDQSVAIIEPSTFEGKDIEATDLRAGAAMIIAGLIAKGTTTISNIEHILRGYSNIIEKLTNVGAHISLIDE